MRDRLRPLVGAAVGAVFFVGAAYFAAPVRNARMLAVAAGLGAVLGFLSSLSIGRS
jgi:hypothetical protein